MPRGDYTRCYQCGKFTNHEDAYYGFVPFNDPNGDGTDEVFCSTCVEKERTK